MFAFGAFTVFVVRDAVSDSQRAFVVFGIEALCAGVANAIGLSDTALDVCDCTSECCDVGAFFFFVK